MVTRLQTTFSHLSWSFVLSHIHYLYAISTPIPDFLSFVVFPIYLLADRTGGCRSMNSPGTWTSGINFWRHRPRQLLLLHPSQQLQVAVVEEVIAERTIQFWCKPRTLWSIRVKSKFKKGKFNWLFVRHQAKWHTKRFRPQHCCQITFYKSSLIRATCP